MFTDDRKATITCVHSQSFSSSAVLSPQHYPAAILDLPSLERVTS